VRSAESRRPNFGLPSSENLEVYFFISSNGCGGISESLSRGEAGKWYAFGANIDAVFKKIAENNYEEAIEKLQDDLLEKLDADGKQIGFGNRFL
jgi:hypothetical protein